jgi:hypothetical protein
VKGTSGALVLDGVFNDGDLDRAVMWLERGRILLRPQPDHPMDPVPWVLR